MRYAIKLNESNRIQWATYEAYATDGLVIVDSLPCGDTKDENNITNWILVDGEYLYDPLPNQEMTDDYLETTQLQETLNNLPIMLSEIDEAICTLYELTLEA